ncbi:hypothetical protein WJX84_008921, partial [Apatococcus fuscideae]
MLATGLRNWSCSGHSSGQQFQKSIQGRLPFSRRRAYRVLAGEKRSVNRARWAQLSPSSPPEQAESTATQTDGLVQAAAAALQSSVFPQIDALVGANIQRVQHAFKKARIGPHHFAGSTGYGHGDLGRAAFDEVMAEVMGAEAAIVRTQFVSGTHAIATALWSVLRPGDRMLAVAGRPYDTMEEVIGLRGTTGHGSLREWGVGYDELSLAADGSIDWD